MFKRKVKIFGKSIPIVILIALFSVTAIASASFLLSLLASGTVSSLDAPSGSLSEVDCTITAGLGAFDSCSLSDTHNIAFAISGVDNESAGRVFVKYTVNGNDSQILSFSDGAVPEAVIACWVLKTNANTFPPGTQACEGHNAGGLGSVSEIEFLIDMSQMTPSFDDSLSWVLEAE